MPRFKLLAGKFGGTNETGTATKTIKATDNVVIEDDRDLDKWFPNKFQRLDEPTMRPRDQNDMADESGTIMDAQLHARQVPPEDRSVATRIRNRTIPAGESPPEEDETPSRMVATGEEPPPPEPTADEDAFVEGEPLGDDVTDEFEGAEAGGLRVFRRGRKHYVATAENPTTALNVRKELTKKQDVHKYIKDHSQQ